MLQNPSWPAVLSPLTWTNSRRGCMDQVGDLVGELGRAVLDEDGPEGWPELLPYVLLSASGTPTAKSQSSSLSHAVDVTSDSTCTDPCNGNALGWEPVVTGLRLLSAVAEHAANAAAADTEAFQALVETLQRCLLCNGQEIIGPGDGGVVSPDVRLEAVRALGSVVVSCSRPSDQERLATCLPHLLQAIEGEQSDRLDICSRRKSHYRSRIITRCLRCSLLRFRISWRPRSMAILHWIPDLVIATRFVKDSRLLLCWPYIVHKSLVGRGPLWSSCEPLGSPML